MFSKITHGALCGALCLTFINDVTPKMRFLDPLPSVTNFFLLYGSIRQSQTPILSLALDVVYEHPHQKFKV